MLCFVLDMDTAGHIHVIAKVVVSGWRMTPVKY